MASEWFILMSGLNSDLVTTDHSSLLRCTFSNRLVLNITPIILATRPPRVCAILLGVSMENRLVGGGDTLLGVSSMRRRGGGNWSARRSLAAGLNN